MATRHDAVVGVDGTACGWRLAEERDRWALARSTATPLERARDAAGIQGESATSARSRQPASGESSAQIALRRDSPVGGSYSAV